MTITLTDLAGITKSYLDNSVDVRISDVTANLNPGEEGTFNVTLTNADDANGGVRLHDLALHLQVSDPAVALLVPKPGIFVTSQAGIDPDLPSLESNDRVEEMFIIFTGPEDVGSSDDTLEVAEERDLEFGYEAKAAGTVNITCHVHASIDVDELFGKESGRNATRKVTVKP